jgi:hypothetical protein
MAIGDEEVNYGGIISKLTIGAVKDGSEGEVSFSSGGDGIELGDVQVGSGEATTDLDVSDILG